MPNFSFSNLVSVGNVEAAIKVAVPIWMNIVLDEMEVVAIQNAPKAFSSQRTFTKFSGKNVGQLKCVGPRVQVRAWDLEFTPPSSGYRLGDYDPMTGEPFPGGVNKRGSYITLEDKPEYGEEVKFRHSVWRRGGKAGVPQFKKGFFSEAIRYSFGEADKLSVGGEKHLFTLGVMVGYAICEGMAENIKAQFAAAGQNVTVTVSRPMLATEGGFIQL